MRDETTPSITIEALQLIGPRHSHGVTGDIPARPPPTPSLSPSCPPSLPPSLFLFNPLPLTCLVLPSFPLPLSSPNSTAFGPYPSGGNMRTGGVDLVDVVWSESGTAKEPYYQEKSPNKCKRALHRA